MNIEQLYQLAQEANQAIKRAQEPPNSRPVARKGRFTLRYGYNSSMTMDNVLFALEREGIPAADLPPLIVEMLQSGIERADVPNYLADYYKLFGW